MKENNVNEIEKRKTTDSYGAIVFEAGKVLMIRGYKGWSFPKGHLEVGESPVQCAVREVLEETAVLIRVNEAFLKAVPSAREEDRRRIFFYVGESLEGLKRPAFCNEVEDADWIPVKDAVSMIGFEPDRQVYLKAMAFAGLG